MQFAGLLRFLPLATALVATPVEAAAVVYGSYYDETSATVDCPNPGIAGICRVYFSQTPSNKLVIITNVSCYYAAGAIPFNITLEISATSGGFNLGRSINLNIPQALVSDSNTETNFLVGQGRFPYVTVYQQSQNSMRVKCTIMGRLVDPIQ